MSTGPLVSIIIPCQSVNAHLETCLRSCLQQTYPNLEILVVAPAMIAAEIEMAQPFAPNTPSPIRILSCSQRGINLARNYGFAHAKGEYIQWLDVEDELTPTKLALQVAALERDPTCDIACGEWEWRFYENGQGQCQSRLGFIGQRLSDPLLHFLLHHWSPIHTYLLRRSAAQQLDQMQAWHPQTEAAMHVEYFTLAALVGLRFLQVPGAMVYYNQWAADHSIRCATTAKRIATMQQLYLRFQQEAQTRPINQLSEIHWLLLKQNWNFWSLAPITLTQPGEQVFWLQHRSLPLGMTLKPAEARIVQVMYHAPVRCTFEGFAYRVIRGLWKQVVQQPNLESAAVNTELSRLVGLLPDARPVSLTEPPSDPAGSSVEKLHSSIDAIPLHAPLFVLQRLAVIQLLDKLRLAGLLFQVHPSF